ncbi:hypothetical protein LZ32DRAFT_1202 [Colletotrichum eremochloae]|nr:hypothetical protein LY78DRAFT_214400 [Colletotrichum sublineola]KAK2019916.1 hypothetical protein LZ32DRAFT_1202 [Colletotrichum eremochloae]
MLVKFELHVSYFGIAYLVGLCFGQGSYIRKGVEYVSQFTVSSLCKKTLHIPCLQVFAIEQLTALRRANHLPTLLGVREERERERAQQTH